MVHISSNIEVAEFPVVLAGVNAVGQKDKNDFVFGIGPSQGAREAGVSKRLLGGEYIAGSAAACCGPFKTCCSAVAWVLLFGEFLISGFREEVHAGHLPLVEEKLHDMSQTPGV